LIPLQKYDYASLQVDAAVVTFKLKHPRDYPDVSSTKNFFSLVNSAFNGKRKMLRKSLQHISSSPDIEKALGVAGLPATVSNLSHVLYEVLGSSSLHENLSSF
jgi:16S rRNA A1518/A1519 N6-dimethyltransferase RsmA/KsgA/DIM1 with predicted DNA glycosylase/AP lyase activity